MARMSNDFTAFWVATYYKSWIFAFLKIAVVALLTRRFLHALRMDNLAKGLTLHYK